jgi:hypothetical protein
MNRKEKVMEVILNFTQHKATPDQIEAGVWDLNEVNRAKLIELLTFNEIPTNREINNRATALTKLALAHSHFGTKVMIGGTPYLMSTLEFVLTEAGMIPMYSFTKRQSVEVNNPDGTVTKTNVFKHVGFITMG